MLKHWKWIFNHQKRGVLSENDFTCSPESNMVLLCNVFIFFGNWDLTNNQQLWCGQANSELFWDLIIVV